MKGDLSDLRFADINALLAVRRCQSITSAARELKVTPSQVSKAIVRLEDQFSVQLLVRTSRGVALSDVGERVIPMFEDVVKKLRTLGGSQVGKTQQLTIAGASYLNFLFVPHITLALPDLRLRTLEMPPALIRAWSAENFFDLTLTTSAERLPSSWRAEEIGAIRKGLFCNPRLLAKLGGPKVSENKLRAVPFIGPLYNVNGQFVGVDDNCPLSYSERQTGHETQTILLALELAERVDQLVYGPVIAARKYVEQGTLKELEVSGWDVSERLFVACNEDRVLKRVQSKIVETLSRALSAMQD